MNRALWIVQILLALLFIFAGVMKFVMPVDQMTKQIPLSGGFLHFIGAAEILGGLGLILPRLLGKAPRLAPLAALCLSVIMIGATVITFRTQPGPAFAFPLIVLLLCLFVVRRHRRQAQ
jgi:uncharacterized membrane protein YphA (DoxX/SURF4 family)